MGPDIGLERDLRLTLRSRAPARGQERSCYARAMFVGWTPWRWRDADGGRDPHATPYRSGPSAHVEDGAVAPVRPRGVGASLFLTWLIGTSIVMLYAWWFVTPH